MSARAKPAGCCPPRKVRPLSEARVASIAAVGKALSDPTRIEILRFLSKQPGPVCACDIVASFDLSQPTVSHHLGVLKKAGLVGASRSGLWRFYEALPAGVGVLECLESRTGAVRRAG